MYVLCYSKLLQILVMCNIVNSLLNLSKYLRINYHKLFWISRIVNGRILNCFERVPAYWEPVFLTQYCAGQTVSTGC
jgi:hypothetical protein